LLAGYQYFSSEMISLLFLCVALVFAPQQRGMALFGGAVLVLFSPLSLLHDDAYWMPRRLLGHGWGIEDVLFCFNCGALAWLAAAWPWRDRIEWRLDARTLVRRCLLCVAVFASTLIVFRLAGMPVMPSFILAQTALAAFALAVRPSSWRLMLSAATLFPLYYFLHLALDIALFAKFLDMWRGVELIPVRILGVPIEEILWVLSFGASFPIALAYAVDASIESPQASLERRQSVAAAS
jgi:hypothetical protein